MTVGAEVDAWDPLHHRSPPGSHWTTVNLGETAPGVLTPLAWTLWGSAGETAIRRAGHNLGVLDNLEVQLPVDPDARLVKSFYGRAAMQVEFLATVPGIGCPAPRAPRPCAASSAIRPTTCATPRPGAATRPSPTSCLRFSVATPRRLRREAARTDRWWTDAVTRVHTLDLPPPGGCSPRPRSGFTRTSSLQLVSTTCRRRAAALRRHRTPSSQKPGSATSQPARGVQRIAEAGGGRTTLAGLARRRSPSRTSCAGTASTARWRGSLSAGVAGGRRPLARWSARYAARDGGADPRRGGGGRPAAGRHQRRVTAALPLPAPPAAARAAAAGRRADPAARGGRSARSCSPST